MPLIPTQLASSLERNGNASSAKEGAQKFAQAYLNYASTAVANGIPAAPTFLQLESVLTNLLLPSFVTPGLPLVSAQAMEAALITFWITAAPQTFAGALTAIPPPTLAAQLIAQAIVPTSNKKSATLKLATIFDIWTRTVLITFTPPITPSPLI